MSRTPGAEMRAHISALATLVNSDDLLRLAGPHGLKSATVVLQWLDDFEDEPPDAPTIRVAVVACEGRWSARAASHWHSGEETIFMPELIRDTTKAGEPFRAYWARVPLLLPEPIAEIVGTVEAT